MMEIYKKHKFNKSNYLKYFEQVFRAILIEDRVSEKYDLETIEKIIEQKKLIVEMGEYVKELTWLTHEKTKERARVFSKSKYDYGIMCRELGIEYDAAKSSISYINGELKKNIGESTLDLILEGKVEEAKIIFKFSSGKLSIGTFIMDSALTGISEANYMRIGLSECKNELKYLQNYSRAHHNKWLGKIDKDKMAYIRYILETDNPKFTEDKKEILKVLRGEKKATDLVEEIKKREVF